MTAPDLLGHTPPPLPARQWLPVEHEDEGGPAPRGTPQAWIVAMPGGGWGLDLGDEGIDPGTGTPRALVEGEVVAFRWLQDLPGGTLTVFTGKEGWEASFQDPEEIAGTTVHYRVDYDNDAVFFSLEEAAQAQDGGEDYDVDVWRSNDGPVHFRLEGGVLVEVGDDG